MENENYEEVKETARTFLQVVTSDNLYYGLFLLALMIVAVKIVDLVFWPFQKARKLSIQLNLLKGCIKAFIIFTIGFRILLLSEAMQGFASQILMSSSLIVVVLGFVFQEGLSNIVHGFILSVFKPFQLGDRISVTVDGERITGYVQAIDMRSTIIVNVMNSSHVIVPNSKMDLSVIDNTYFGREQISSNFLDLSVTYESNLLKAMDIVSEVILAHPMVQKAREKNKITGPLNVLVRDLGDSGIYLRATVMTLTVEENFTACSDIRRDLVLRFDEEPDVEFAYPHMQIVSEAAAPEGRERHARGSVLTTPEKM